MRRQVFAEEFQHLRIEPAVEASTVEARRFSNTLEGHRLRFAIRAREGKIEMCGIDGTAEFRVAGQVLIQGHDIFRSDTHAAAFRAPQLNGDRYLLQTGLLTPSHTQMIGDGSAGTFGLSDSGTVTSGQVYQITGSMYGFMPPSQDLPAGNYSDSIVVAVTYRAARSEEEL
jgi:hypothetical protein